MKHTPPLYNVQRYQDGKPLDLMLGMSCDRETAIHFADRYNANRQALINARRREGHDTPDWHYVAIPVNTDIADWMPLELVR